MAKTIGIRREDKNEWERRVPLTPTHVKELKEKHGIHTIVQPSPNRTFTDDEYKNAGAELNEDLGKADVILAVKEIPIKLFEKDKTYIFFSHTIKGQPYNMPMLKHIMGLNCNLIDYERVVDENNRRLIFFGRYAGLAGMIETLHAFGQKIKLQGFDTPLEKIKQAYEYSTMDEAKQHIEEIGEELHQQGIPHSLCPLVVGFAGYGNVSRGAQEIFDLLPHKTISGHILDEMYENFSGDDMYFYKVVFNEEDMVRPLEGDFELQDYYKHPEKYVSRFENYLPYLSMLVNCIYWTEDYPRLITKKYLKTQTYLKPHLTLKVIGDISCDINGSIEITHKATMPDTPSFTYFPQEDKFEDGVHRGGVTVMAVDNLPCEFPKDSSEAFSAALKDFIPSIATESFDNATGELKLPAPITKALILHKGKLTPDYSYIEDYLK